MNTAIVNEQMEYLKGLQYFELQQQWTLLRACINTRPRYLVRSLPPTMSEAVLREFDKAVSNAVLGIMQASRELMTRETYDTFHALRGLPLMLGGSPLTHASRPSERRKHVRKARVLSYKFVTKHLQRLQPIFDRMWSETMPRTSFRPTENYEPDGDDPNPINTVLQGHPLGSIPPTAIFNDTVAGVPDLATTSPQVLRQQADQDALVESLLLHTTILNGMRNSEQQNRKLFAAQVLSQSCPNSGHALQWWPCRGNVIKSGQFIQLLRKRFAIPCLLPPDDDYACSCGGRRVAATLKNDPYHALHCKAEGRSWRTTARHDDIAKVLAKQLQRVPGLESWKSGTPNTPPEPTRNVPVTSSLHTTARSICSTL